MANPEERARKGHGLSLRVNPSKDRYSYGEPIVLEYALVNDSDEDIRIVDDRQYTLCLRDREATVCDPTDERCTLNSYLGEIPIPPNTHIAGYMVPTLRTVNRGTKLRGVTAICLPLRQTIVNERCELQEIVVSMANDVAVRLFVGYGVTEFAPDLRTLNTREQFLRWQQFLNSNVVAVAIR